MIVNRFFSIPAVFLFFLFILSCNPVSEEIKGQLWDSAHNSKPFQSDFFHSADYRFPGSSCSEVQCHGKTLTGGNSGAPSCLSCHDDQWTIFGISHTKKISGFYHRNDIDDYPADRDNNALWFNSCTEASCHGADLEGNQPVPGNNAQYRYSCKSCHGSFAPNTIPPPGHRSRESDDGQTGWHHYRYESAHPGGTGTNSYCSGTACHGTDGRTSSDVNALSSIPGLAAHGPACGECH